MFCFRDGVASKVAGWENWGMSNFPDGGGSGEGPLEYARRVGDGMGRPGILTAVGIISIVVGSLSVLGSLGSVGSGVMYLVMSNMTIPAPVMVQPAGVTTMPSGGVAATALAGVGQRFREAAQRAWGRRLQLFRGRWLWGILG